MAARRALMPGLGKAELSVADQLARLEARIAQLEATPTTPQVQTSNFAAKEGQFVVVEAPPEGISALLPQARAQNRNRRITFNAKNSNPIRLLSVNGLVNNQSSVVSTSPGTFDAVSDGATGWFITSQAASAAGGTNNATYFLETADASLPNARVGTDSTEIDVDYTVASVVSWALRASSVVFSKLQNLTGLSVLGRAANSTGVMAAITASGARQALMSDAAGTSIAWRAITTSDVPAHTWSQVLTAGATSGANNPVVDVGQFLQLGATDTGAAGTEQIRCGDSVLRMHGDFATFIIADLNVRAVAGTQFEVTTAGIARLVIASTGEWSTPSGSSGQFFKHNGAASPVWATFALSDLPSQAADTFLGRLAGAGTPAAQNLSALASTSIVYDATSHTFQRAALTGAIAAGQNGNGSVFAGIRDNGTLETPGRTNLNFLSTTSVISVVTQDSVNDELEITHERAALTGAITASQNSNTTAFGAAAAKSVLANATNASAVPAFLAGTAAFQYLRVNSGNTGLEWATLSSHGSTSIAYDGASNQFQRAAITGVVEVGANLNTSTFGTNIISVPLVETALSGPVVSAGGGAYWVRDTTPNRPVFKDDAGGNWNLFPNTVAANTAVVSVSAGTGTAAGASFSTPANTWAVGTCYKVEGFLLFTRGATATALNVVVELSFGGTVFATATIPTFTIAGTGGALINGWLLCLSTGASATFLANIKTLGDMENLSAAPTNGQVWSAATGSGNLSAFGTTKNTGAANTLTLQAHMDASVVGTTITWAHAHIYRIAQTAN